MHVFIAALHRPIHPTGVCRHAANLAICLAERPEVKQISLVIGTWQQDYFAQAFSLTSEKIEIVTVDIPNSSLARNKWFVWGLPQIANSLQVDLVHLSFPFPIVRAKFNAPVVTTIHDLYPFEFPENFGFPRAWFNRLFLWQCVRNSDGLACVSKVTLDKLKFYFPRLKPQQKVEVIYNYVDFQGIESERPQAIAEASLFWLSVAQHRANKNLDILIKSYSELLKAQAIPENTQLVIVGTSGPETNNINHLIEQLSLQSQVKLLSAISDRHLCWLYQNCQIFVIASSTEGFCLPLAEAMNFSDCLVCSRIPIFQEIGSTKCTYFSLTGDVVANLSKAIVQALESNLSLDSSEIKRFNKLKVARQYINLYSSVAKM